MILEVKQKKKKEQLLHCFNELRDKKKISQSDDTSVYSVIPFDVACKFGLLIPGLITHPLVIRKRKFYEMPDEVRTKDEVIKLIASILERELTVDLNKTKLSDSSRQDLIKAHAKLSKKGKSKCLNQDTNSE